MLFVIYVLVGLSVTVSVYGSDNFHTAEATSHCFKRISGGERLIGYDVTRIIERNTVGECEEECNVYKCTHFSFGNATDGNGTCELTTDREISRTQDPNFDLYQRTNECAEGKPTGYEKACYRRIITGKRLHERFIRHSLPCNSLQACQHQCSIEKHFACQGFNIRLDPAKVGRGICELSSVSTAQLDPGRDFVFDPEFAYYERDHDNGLPNCGHFDAVPNAIPSHNPEDNTIGFPSPASGGPYYGGDSYGPWSTGHGTVDHGPWGSHGYGSGFYESNNPSRGRRPSFHPDTSGQRGPYSGQGQGQGQTYGFGYGYGGGRDPQGNGPGGPGGPPVGAPGGRPGGPPGGPGSYFPNTALQPGTYGYGGQGPPGYDGKGLPWGGSSSFQPNTQGSYFGYNNGYGTTSRFDGFGGNPFRGSGPSFQPGQPGYPSYPGQSGYPTHPGHAGYPSHPGQPGQSGQSGQPGQPGTYPGYGYGYGYGYSYGGWSQSFGSQGDKRPGSSFQPGPYGQGGDRPYPDRSKVPDYPGGKPWGGQYPTGDRRRDRPNRIPTYIIIDADSRGKYGGGRPNYQPYRPGVGYLPAPPPGLPAPRPLPPPETAQRLPQRPPIPPLPPRQPPSYPFPPRDGDKFGITSNTIGREVCFRREHPGYKLNTNTIRGMYETPTVLECEAMCTSSPFKCTGYSYRYSSPGSGPNCLLTDYTSLNPETHLLPDRSCDVYFKMGTCVEFDRRGDTECFLRVASNRKLDPGKIVKAVTVRGMSECELACLSSGFFTCRSYSFRHGPPVIGEPVENCFLSDWPISALTHLDFLPNPNHEIFERGSFGHGCELDFGSTHIGPRPPFASYPNVPQITHAKDPWGVGETWRHFTVSGWPCRVGTECELNPQAGFWTCEVEGGDRAQWDYCCRPKHSCGFSRGYHYPWCYVGEAGPEQWRPCSEYYFPDFGNRPQYKPVQSHNPHPDHSYGPPRDTRPWNFGSEEYGPPSHWPISYIYAEPPPNETYVWDPEDQLFYHHDDDDFEHYELHPPPEPFPEEESPRIRFKPCGGRHPYPRAIIQKLDLKNIPKAGNPEEQLRKDEKPRGPKAEPEPPDVLGFSPENRDKKSSPDFFSSSVPPTLAPAKDTNGTGVPLNKTKEVIKEVEKIILESSTGAETEKNESLKRVETKYPGFFEVSLLEKPEFWN